MVVSGKDLRPGTVLRIDYDPWLVQETELTQSGPNSSIVKATLKNLSTGNKTEKIYFDEDKINDVLLNRREATLSSINGDTYTFMDTMNYTKYEVNSEDIQGVLPFIEEGMLDVCKAVFFEGKLVTIELPITISRRVSYVDPSLVDGEQKRAQLTNGTHIMVPDYVKADDMTSIDTRRGSFAKTQ